MHVRSLVIAPVVVIASVMLVGAVIQTGQQARAGQDPAASRARSLDPGIVAERDRVDSLVATVRDCGTRDGCTDGDLARRYAAAAERVGTWPPDQRFGVTRALFVAQLDASARMHGTLAAADADGRVTLSERLRVERSIEQRTAAADDAARVSRDAGIIDQPTYRAARDANERAAAALLERLGDR